MHIKLGQKMKILGFERVHLRVVAWCQLVKMESNGFQKKFGFYYISSEHIKVLRF